jgi:hypothetical protein
LLSRPESDVDIKGICVPPLSVILDPFGRFEQVDDPKGLNDFFGDPGAVLSTIPCI